MHILNQLVINQIDLLQVACMCNLQHVLWNQVLQVQDFWGFDWMKMCYLYIFASGGGQPLDMWQVNKLNCTNNL